MKYLGWPYREYIKAAKTGGFCEELLSENDFEAVLAIFCCYGDYGTNASDALCCYNLLNSQNIPINQ